MNNPNKSIYSRLRYLIILISISFCFTGGDCEKILENNPDVPSPLIGNWTLVLQTGALQDICPGENAVFRSDGVAQLICPGEDTLSRNFDVVNNRLTYSQTSVSYDIEFIENDTEVWLYGTNVSRNLKYRKIITADAPAVIPQNTDFINSSEKR